MLDEFNIGNSKVLFNLFRKELAVAAEILKPNNYFGTPDDEIDWKTISTMTDYFGFWSIKPKDPIWYLLAHSDSAGIISVEQQILLAPRLLELSKKLPGTDHFPNWKKLCKDLAVKMSNAQDIGKDIEFK